MNIARHNALTEAAPLADHQRVSFDYFLTEVNPENRVIADRMRDGSPASIAAVSVGLAGYPIAMQCLLRVAIEVTLVGQQSRRRRETYLTIFENYCIDTDRFVEYLA